MLLNPRFNPRLIRQLWLMMGCLTLVACAGMEAEKAVKTEELLAAAGFQLKLADTPDQMAHVQTLTQHQLVPHQKDGKVYYVYADAITCKCLY